MSSMVMRSPQQRTLQILEIVELVLAFVDRPTANQCARVCRLWKEPAFNAYWRCLDDDYDFAEMLLPFLLPDSGRCRRCPHYKPLIHFHEHPTRSDWERFLRRASRVKHVELSPLTLRMEDLIENDTFDVLALSRPPDIKCALPRLRSVGLRMYGFGSLSSEIQGDVIFHDGIREVTLDLTGFEMIEPMDPDDDTDDVDVSRACLLLSEIAELSPKIVKLHVTLEETVHAPMKDALCELLAQLKMLEVFACSLPEMITTEIVLALKHHQWLRTITLGKSDETDTLWEGTVFDEDASYPNLECLEFCSSLAEIPPLFDGRGAQLPFLTRFWLKIVLTGNGPNDIHGVISNISWHCANLEQLKILFSHSGPNPTRVQFTGKELWPLRFLKYLKLVQITHAQGFAITDDELVDLIANLPILRILRLGHRSPDEDDEDDFFLDWISQHKPPPPQLTLNFLALLSNIPNQLEELSVHVRAWNLVGVADRIGRRLQTLEEISFGSSPVASCRNCMYEIARFLAIVLPSHCIIGFDETDQVLRARWASVHDEVETLRRCNCHNCRRSISFVPRHWHEYRHSTFWTNGNQ